MVINSVHKSKSSTNFNVEFPPGKHVVFGKLADMGLSFSVVKKVEKMGNRSGAVNKNVIIKDCGEII